MKRSSRYSLIAGGACCGCTLAAALWPLIGLADWETVPDIRMEIEANDNPRLGQQTALRGLDPEAVEGRTSTRMLLDGRVLLRNAGPRGTVTLQPRARLDAYADAIDEDLQRRDLYLNSRAEYNWQRTTAGIQVNLGRESIISAELADTGVLDPDEPIDPVDNETGVLALLDEFRIRSIVSPYAEFALSERSAILLGARLLDVAYTGPDLRGRTDFRDTSFSVGVGRTIDDRTGATARLVVSQYEADLTGNETDTVGVEGTFNRQLNEIWSFNLMTGLQRSDFVFIDDDGELVDNATTNYTMSIAFAKRTELASFDIGLFRFLNPNAVGFLVERNEFRLRYGRRLSERMRVGIGFRAMETGALDSDIQDREFLRADFDLEWAFSPTWAFAARYGAVDQTFSGERLDGTANVLSVGAVYRGIQRPR
jgi:hypothetical protein